MFITIPPPWRWLSRPIDRSIKSFQKCTNLTLRLSMLRSFLVKTCTMSSAMSLFSIEAGGCTEDLDEALGIIVTEHPSYKFTPQLPLLNHVLSLTSLPLLWRVWLLMASREIFRNTRNPGNWCNLRRFVTTTWQRYSDFLILKLFFYFLPI